MNNYQKNIFKSIISLKNMIKEMEKKNIELKRLSKTASLLIKSGLSSNSIPEIIIKKCISSQNKNDGGWISIVDTIWNTYFLYSLDKTKYQNRINSGINFIKENRNSEGLWGRSKRDISRIPVSGLLLFLFPEYFSYNDINKLEKLWESELNSITYKAAYYLLAKSKFNNDNSPTDLVLKTINWLIQNQRNDGGFSPWIDHPVDSNIFCTSIATLGLMSYKDYINKVVFQKSLEWISSNQLNSGIWKYHEIEDGASWGLYALSKLNNYV